jgi:hypothetical protein
MAACCDEDKASYYRYDQIEFEYSHGDTNTEPLPSGAEFTLSVHTPKLTQVSKKSCFSLVPAAHAVPQCPRGDYRHAYIRDVTIVSDADYNDEYPAGSDLTYLISASGLGPKERFEPFVYRFREGPTAAKMHRFAVTIRHDEHGDMGGITAQSESVVWE